MFKNFKTTLAGLGSVITGIVMIVKGNVIEGVTAITTGIGLVLAKDHDDIQIMLYDHNPITENTEKKK
jgi:hypothetical protein